MSLARRTFLQSAAGTIAAAGSVTAAASADANARKLDGAKSPQFIIAALATLNRQGRLDEALTKDYLAYLEKNGVDAVLVNGSTGEFASFSAEERKHNLQVFMRNKGGLRGMCHIGAPSIPETTELLRHAEDQGVDWVLVLPPYYYKNPSVEGLVRYYEPILEAAKVPVMLYNIPQVSAVEISLELVRRLSKHPRLYGIKDSWGKAERTSAYIREFPELKIFTGASALIEMVLQQGGAGALTGNGNIFPKQTAGIFKAFREKAGAGAPQKRLNELVGLLRGYPIIPVMKFVLGEMGFGPMTVRPPLTELLPEQKEELRSRLKNAGVLS